MAIVDSRKSRRLFRYGRITPLTLVALGGSIIALFVSVLAMAQTPTPPANAKTGHITGQQFPLVRIDGREYRLAPGARIYNRERLTLTPNMVPADTAVKFVLDEQGAIRTVWLIDPKELSPGARRTGPRSNQ